MLNIDIQHHNSMKMTENHEKHNMLPTHFDQSSLKPIAADHWLNSKYKYTFTHLQNCTINYYT